MDCTLVFHVFKDIYLNVIMQIHSLILNKKMFEKNCHEYIYVHDLDFPLMRERALPRWPMLFVDLFVNEEFKISL